MAERETLASMVEAELAVPRVGRDQPIALAEAVKAKARSLGADLVGIADCETLNANPPDPTAPQTTDRISSRFKSCIVLAKRMPFGEFLSDHRWAVAHTNQVIMRVLERTAYRLSCWLEESFRFHSLQVASDETDPELKRGSYGYLSLRHLAVEAGLGSFGLEANLLTPEYGPRVYFAAVLTEAELRPDGRMKDQICIGEKCGRCLLSCPTDAILHWTLDKRLCAKAAQIHGIGPILSGPVKRLVEAPNSLSEILADPDTAAKWMSIVRMVESFGVCPRCIEVCPVGGDYHTFLAREHRVIPEATQEKRERLRTMQRAAKAGEIVSGNPPVSRRFIGPNGFDPQKFHARQREETKRWQKRTEQDDVPPDGPAPT